DSPVVSSGDERRQRPGNATRQRRVARAARAAGAGAGPMSDVMLRVRQYRPRSPVVLGVGIAILTIALVTGYGVALLALAIGIPVACAVALRPQRGVILLTAVLPFDGIIKQFGPGFLGPWKQIAILGLLLLTFVCPAEARGAKGRKLPTWIWAVAGLL